MPPLNPKIKHCYHTHCHFCPIRYSFSPESSEAFLGLVPCPRTQNRNNVPILRGEKHDFSLKILHQAGFETAGQATTMVAVSSSPSPWKDVLLYPKNPTWRWPRAIPTPRSKNIYNFLITATSELSMQAWKWNFTDSKKPVSALGLRQWQSSVP